MDSSEIYDYATKQGWLLIHEGDYTHVYEKQLSVTTIGCHGLHANRKYIYVSLHSNGEYDKDGSRMVIPHQGDMFVLDDDEDATVLIWWLNGNEGSEDDWWNQATVEERNAKP